MQKFQEITHILEEIKYFTEIYPQKYINFEKEVLISKRRAKQNIKFIINLYQDLDYIIDKIPQEREENDDKVLKEEENPIKNILRSQIEIKTSMIFDMINLCKTLKGNSKEVLIKENIKKLEDLTKNAKEFFDKKEGRIDLLESLLKIELLMKESKNLFCHISRLITQKLENEFFRLKCCNCDLSTKIKMINKSVMTSQIKDFKQELKKIVKINQGILECDVSVSNNPISELLSDEGNRTFLSFKNKDTYLAVQNNIGYSLIKDGRIIDSKKMDKCKWKLFHLIRLLLRHLLFWR